MAESKKVYTKVRDLKNGGQAQVVLVKDQDGNLYAKKEFVVQGYQEKKLKRAKQEIEIIKKLANDNNIVKVYSHNLDDLKPEGKQKIFYIMDFARYGSLKDNDFYIGDIEASLSLFKEILIGVAAAHKKQIIHRDLKPDNILLYPTQKKVVISDFGISLVKDDKAELTETDEILGPAHFMAPEQFKSPNDADERSDMYSLGKILFYMITGKGKLYREEIGDLSQYFTVYNPYLTLIEDRLLKKMVNQNPDARYQTAGEVIDEVNQILDQVTKNSNRLLKKDKNSFSMYDLLSDGRKQEFLDGFSKDLAFNMRILESVAEELTEKNKERTLENLKKELLEANTKAKSQAAIKTTLKYVEDPDTIRNDKELEKYSFAHYYQAKFFYNASSYEQAHNYIIKAIQKETNKDLKLRYLLIFALISKKCKCAKEHDFDERLTELLSTSTSSDTKAKLYKELAKHFLDLGENRKGLVFLEAYLALRPSDTDRRWECAYKYSDLDLWYLSYHHYQIYLKTIKGNASWAYNNLGALLSDKDMPVNAMQMYKDAAELGHARAGRNIAQKYIEIGLVDKAREILRKIVADNYGDDYDSIVDETLGSIPQLEEKEDDKLKKVEEQGSLVNIHHIEAAKRYFTDDAADWEGYWKTSLGLTLDVRSAIGSLRATDYNKKWEIDLKFDKGICYIDKLRTSGTYSNKSYTGGIIYLTIKKQFKGYVLDSEGDPVEISGTKVSKEEIEQELKNTTSSLQQLLTNMQGVAKDK